MPDELTARAGAIQSARRDPAAQPPVDLVPTMPGVAPSRPPDLLSQATIGFASAGDPGAASRAQSGDLDGDTDPELRPHADPAAGTRIPAMRAPLVGRAEQLHRLKQLFLDSWEKHRLSFVTLVGESGAGKTRLAREFALSVRAAIPEARVLWGASADSSGPRYEAVAGALAERFGIGHAEPAYDVRSKIGRTVNELLGDQPQAGEVTHLLAHLMGVTFPDSPIVEALRHVPGQLDVRCYIAVRRFLERHAQEGPLLLCFDGMENVRVDTVNLIHYLVHGLHEQPVLILTTARPSLFERHPHWGRGELEHQRIEVAPLLPEEAVAMFCALIRTERVPDPVLAIARQRLRGSPRALNDFARLLVETGVLQGTEGRWELDAARVQDGPLPETHDDLLRARLRALPRGERELLCQAATLGEVFWADALVALRRAAVIATEDADGPPLTRIAGEGERQVLEVARALKTLSDRGLIVESALSSIGGEREYRFAYAPIGELAYDLLRDTTPVAATLQSYHTLMARWIELRPEGQQEQRQEQVGQQLERGGDARAAAARYGQAAEAARARFDNEKSIRLYQRALRCLGSTDLGDRLRLWHELGTIYQARGDLRAAHDAFERMVRLAWTVASRPQAAIAFNQIGRVWRQRGDLELAIEYLSRGLEMSRAAGNRHGVAEGLDELAQTCTLLGDYDQALDHAAKGLELRRQLGDRLAIARSLTTISTIERERGLFAEAEACCEEALALRRPAGDLEGLVTSLIGRGALDLERGQQRQAREHWEEALADAERIGLLSLQLHLLLRLTDLSLREGRLAEARQRLEAARPLAERIGDRLALVELLRCQALVELEDGHSERAQRTAERALDRAREARLEPLVGRVHGALGAIHAATLFDASATTGSDATAEGHFQLAVEVHRRLGCQSELARMLQRLGAYRIEREEWARGRQDLQEALQLCQQLGLPDADALERTLRELPV
ncbi:MAG: tetratricopeptide repeat protein [Proteobacteria bacterium]|nr:tetratricopeptide repeat protein [Pseudomonadota bacterium]